MIDESQTICLIVLALSLCCRVKHTLNKGRKVMNDVAIEQHTQHSKQCKHEHCLNHKPEWKRVGTPRIVINPGLFGAKTYWLHRCCHAAMERRKQVQTQQCATCGRIQYWEQKTMAVCLCCGRVEDTTPYSD